MDIQDILESLTHQLRPVSYRTAEVSSMDIIELCGVYPFIFQIVNFEFHVWRNERGLDGTDVVPKDFCCRVFVSEIDGPDTSASGKIQYSLWLWSNGCKMQFTV